MCVGKDLFIIHLQSRSMMRYRFLALGYSFIFLLFASCVVEKAPVEQENNLVETVKKDSVTELANPPADSKLIPSSAGTALVAVQKKKDGNLSVLQSFKRKYPSEINLLKNPGLKSRLKALLGTELYAFVKRIRQVESPIEMEDGLFYSWAMQMHSGGDPSAVIMVDFEKDVVYVGIRRDKKSTIYSEDGGEAPQKLIDWTNEPYFEDLVKSGVFN